MSVAFRGQRAAVPRSYTTAWSPSSSSASWRRHCGYGLVYRQLTETIGLCDTRPITPFAVCNTRRYASSRRQRQQQQQQQQPSTTRRSSSPYSTTPEKVADDINPSPSTRPADLVLPDSLPSSAPTSDKLKRYITVGRAYLTFYKTGLKSVYHNYRDSLPLRRSLRLPAYLPISPPPVPFSPSKTPFSKGNNCNDDDDDNNNNNGFYAAAQSSDLTRNKFQLVCRSAYDVRRIIPFSVLLIVCGELTPLVVLAVGNAVTPYTCRVPKQVEKTRTQKAARKREAVIAHQVKATGSVTGLTVGSDEELDLLAGRFGSPAWVETASADEILRACAVFGLARTHTHWTGLVPVVYRPRLRKYVAYLGLDDRLIRKGGGASALDAAEVRIAVDERGGVDVAQGKYGWEGEREQRKWLERWLKRRD